MKINLTNLPKLAAGLGVAAMLAFTGCAQDGAEVETIATELEQPDGDMDMDDELPAFFYEEPVAPTDKIARHHAPEVNKARSAWFAQNTG